MDEEEPVTTVPGALPGAGLVTGFRSAPPVNRVVTDSSSSDLSAAAPMTDEPGQEADDDAMLL